MKIRRSIALFLAVVMVFTVCSVTAFAAEDDTDIKDCEILFDGEEWKIFSVENKTDQLTVDDLQITFKDAGGEIMPSDVYELKFGTLVWDEESERDIFTEISEPFSLMIDDDYMQAGFGGFAVYAVAKDDSGYSGQTEPREFMLWHKYSFNWFGANADFGEEYKGQCMWSWHDYFEIPADRVAPPVIHGIDGSDPGPENYEITYFERGEIPDFDDPEYDAKLYPENNPMKNLPTEIGKYFAKIDGKAPYYGTSYVDFDIYDSFAAEHGKDRRYYDGDTLYITQGEATDVRFDTEPVSEGYIVGWLSDDLSAKGFNVASDPVFFTDDGDDHVYAHIETNELSPGTKAVMTYSCYRFRDVFRDGSFIWDEATPIYTRSLFVEVAPAQFSYLSGDANGDGEVNIIDATVIQRELAEVNKEAYADTIMQGDVDENGKLEILDATYIRRNLALMRIPCTIGKPIIL